MRTQLLTTCFLLFTTVCALATGTGCVVPILNEQKILYTIDFRNPSSVETYFLERKHLQIKAVILEDGEVLSSLEEIGEGHAGTVFRIGETSEVIKIAKDHRGVAHIKKEIADQPKFASATILTPTFSAPATIPAYYVRKTFVIGPSLKDMTELTDAQIASLAVIFHKAFRDGLVIDVFKADNFKWSESHKEFVVVDCGLVENTQYVKSVSLTAWKSLFTTHEDRVRFTDAIKMQFGESFLSEVGKKETETALSNHALRHEIEWIFGDGH